MLINEARVQQAIDYLTETDFPCADAKVNAERWKYIADRRKAHVILTEEGTIQEKKAKSEVAKEVIEAEDEYFLKLETHERIRAKRQTEQLVIEVWRTEQANLRKA